MSYRRALIRRWSRRDRLAVLVVAVSVAFLTGAVLMGAATTAELTAVAADHESPASIATYDSPGDALAAASPDSIVLPLGRVDTPDGPVTIVGIPDQTRSFADRTGLALPEQPPPGEARAPIPDTQTISLEGDRATATIRITPHETQSVFSPRWYVAHPNTVEELGITKALVLSPSGVTEATAQNDASTPVRGVFAFFVLGAQTLLQTIGLVAVGAAVLLGVTIFSTTRIAVRDRRRTIRVARATGARRRTVLGLFGARAGLQTAVGVALGYAIGVIAPNLAVNATVFAGNSTSLSLRVTPQVAGVLLAVYAGLVAVGVVGGILAARPIVRRPPSRLATTDTDTGVPTGQLPDKLRPTLLDRRALVPTATTLTVFVTLVVLLASTYAVVAPLASGQGTTVTEPGAAHPFASNVPESYADEFHARGVPASAEILLLEVTDGQSYVARGAEFPAFANVTDATIMTGRPPEGLREVVVGVDLLRTLDVEVGDRLVLGGSTDAAVERVHVVGAFRAPEPYDDQLVVPLSTARRLSTKSADNVHLVRTADSPNLRKATGVEVVSVDAPTRTSADDAVTASVTLVNPSADTRKRTLTVTFDGETRTTAVALDPGERRTVTVEFPTGKPRTATLTVANHTRHIDVVAPGSLVISGLPERVPPESEPRVRILTATGEPVADVAVAVAGRTVRTNEDGYVRLLLTDSGSSRIVASKGNRSTTTRIAVDSDAERRLQLSITVTPESPTVTAHPEAHVVVRNPWNATVERSLSVAGPGQETTETIQLDRDGRETVDIAMAQQPPGTYDVAVTVDGTQQMTTTYRVRGDQRLAAALASSGRRGATTGIGQSLSVVLGNVGIVFATLLLLAGLMTVGGTAAGFASAVDARRRTLGVHRSMGATRGMVLWMVLRDALLIGVAATAMALLAAGITLWLLDTAGLLTVYGVRLLATVEPLVVAGSAAAATGIALAGAGLAAASLLVTPPAWLLAGERSMDSSTKGETSD